jgi:hypothetical protein
MTMTVATMKTPYIGVTDFVSHDQVKQALECIPDAIGRRLHVGVMASYKTVSGIKTRTGWENIWPRNDALRSIFQPDPKVFNVLHYADFDEPSFTTADHVLKICKEAGPYLHGVQLDMAWPDVSLVEEIKQCFPDFEIILQIGNTALKRVSDSTSFLDEWVRPYTRYVDYFLIDASMGKGQPMSPSHILGCFKEMSDVVDPDSMTAAGGLGPRTYDLLHTILAWSNRVSCDAQGQLRSSGRATDPIEMSRVCDYIRGVCDFLRR